ncbi:DUF6151 family protein [Ruegeria profundi]|uniref:DUF6151 family protein n=1 Tax=Ruegeria profundi TaxID=1685378 RepID=UPI001CD3C4C8|nr:DUF6151 family protein [Ruegeria profundi]MCA0927492.1 DUF6151 family protein [Ruegeria profundi]
MSSTAGEGMAFSCICGALQGRITAAGVQSGTHVGCFCRDCRAAQLYFGQPGPAPGPVDILQMSPEEIRIDKGAEYLALMQLSPKGMLRWYAKCCNAPLATTARTVKVPFAGFIANRFVDPGGLGPITTRGFVPQPDGKQKHENLRYAVVGMLRRLAKSWVSGSWKNTPFFDCDSGEPVAVPIILSKAERAKFYT